MQSSCTMIWRKRYTNNIKTSKQVLNILCPFKRTNVSCLLIYARIGERKSIVCKDE